MNTKLLSGLVLGLGLLGLNTTESRAADFTMDHGRASTITVEGCGRAEVGDVKVTPSIKGEHRLTTRCLPVYCAYTNETPIAWAGTKWTIKLLARDVSRDSTGVFKGDPQFDRRFDKILHEGIETKKERDAIIQRYLRSGTCQKVRYDKNISAV